MDGSRTAAPSKRAWDGANSPERQTPTEPADRPKDEPPDDLVLLKAVAGEDRGALEVLFRRWNGRFLGTATAILRNAQSAEDAASEALLRIHRLATNGDLPSDAEEATRWIQAQIRSSAYRQLEEHRTVGGEWISRLPGPEDAMDDSTSESGTDQKYVIIEKALGRLSRRTREAILMHYLDNLSYRRISAIQGGTPAGARSRVDRGILLLVAMTHSRMRGRQKAESARTLTSDEKLEVRNTAATLRRRDPAMGLRALAAEVCRRTGILILPESTSASLLDHSRSRRA